VELCRPIYGRINFAPELLLDRSDGAGDRLERSVPNDEQINVAVRRKFGPRRRTKDECRLDFPAQGRQGPAQDVRRARGLDHDPLQLSEDR
jgi:hypothetical protein